MTSRGSVRLTVAASAADAARRAAVMAAAELAQALDERGEAFAAFSGGAAAAPMLAALGALELDWGRIRVFQVDERCAPEHSPERNLTALLAALPGAATVHPMPVEPGQDDAGLTRAADAYAALLPARFDLVHLGLGVDGHTASLVPGDAALVADRLVAFTAPYQGWRRLTLTYAALERARRILWLVTGEDKAEALPRLLAADPTAPAGRVSQAAAVVVADRAAASRAADVEAYDPQRRI
ncbi:MAG: 6-phosphogluconolactonase [Acidimicrobiales bacterium]